MGWEHPGRAPGPVLKPSGSSSPTSLGSSCAGWSLPPPLSMPVGARRQPLGQGWARDSGGTHYGQAIVIALPWSPSLLCHFHHHCCAMVIVTAVSWSPSLLCQCHCHCCVMVTVIPVPVSLSLLCHVCHGYCHHCARVTVVTVSWSPLPSAIQSAHPSIPIPQTPTSIILILTLMSRPPAREPPWLHPNLTSLPSPPAPSRSPAVFGLALARPGRV